MLRRLLIRTPKPSLHQCTGHHHNNLTKYRFREELLAFSLDRLRQIAHAWLGILLHSMAGKDSIAEVSTIENTWSASLTLDARGCFGECLSIGLDREPTPGWRGMLGVVKQSVSGCQERGRKNSP
jgi:hypothetical protein